MENRAPRWIQTLLRWCIREDYWEEISGDMEERFQDNASRHSLQKARRLYFFDVVKLLRPRLIGWGTIRPQTTMFRYNLKIVWRQMMQSKVFSSIKIGGFAVGIAACILIALYTSFQSSHDQHYHDKDRIFRVVNQWSQDGEVGMWANVHGPLKEVLEDYIPEIELVARVVIWPWADAGENNVRKVTSGYNEYESGFLYADPELLDILEFSMVYGSRDQALAAPNAMVISQSKAEQYFPCENPVGQQLVLNDNPETTYTIGGVFADLPDNSHLQADFIMTLFERTRGPGTSGWCCTNYNMYVKLDELARKQEVENKTSSLRNSVVIGELRRDGQSGLDQEEKYQSYYFQPIQDIYFNPEGVGDDLVHGSLESVQLFNVIAVIILVLACINFVQLSIARSIKRAKEVGMKKVIGSSRLRLVIQYLTESCTYALMAVLLGVLCAWLALPSFNLLADVPLQLPWSTTWFVPSLLAGTLVIGILSGIYPAFLLSGFKPIHALQGHLKGSHQIGLLRSGMVIFQFTATVILIVGALVMHRQFQFLMNKSLGYEKESVINILGLESIGSDKRDAFKEQLDGLSYVESSTLSDFLPVEGGMIQNRSYWVAERRQTDNGYEAARWVIDEDYLQTMSIQISEGRNFEEGSLDERSMLINEQMALALHLDNPLGARIIDMFDEEYTVVGVVKDFHFESLFHEVRPLVLVRGKGSATLSLKMASTDASSVQASLGAIESTWQEFDMPQGLRFSFMDQRFERMYFALNRIKMVFIWFAVLSICIACLGLFAMSVHVTGQRQKEVSVRKVLGARVLQLAGLLTADFIKLVLVAIVLAIPIAWFFMDLLLQDMPHRINLSWSIFFIGSAVALVVALISVGVETIKVARSGIAERLR